MAETLIPFSLCENAKREVERNMTRKYKDGTTLTKLSNDYMVRQSYFKCQDNLQLTILTATLSISDNSGVKKLDSLKVSKSSNLT